MSGAAAREATLSPTFSAIIPTHQSKEFVLRAIRCVLTQSDPDFEIVVIDNGSTDGTDEAVSAIDDRRIVYRWQEDSGLPADSRNKGVEVARGVWVAFLDADDTWHPEKLARVRSVVDADSGLDAVCHDVDIVDLAGTKIGERAYRLDDRPIYEQLLYRGNFLSTSAMTVRRAAIVAAGGFDIRPEYFTVEDLDLWFRLAEAGSRFAILPETLGEYYVHPGGASSRLVRHYDALMRVLEEHAVLGLEQGHVDIGAALARRSRSRLAEVQDLVRHGSVADAVRVLLALPGEMRAARKRLVAAASIERAN